MPNRRRWNVVPKLIAASMLALSAPALAQFPLPDDLPSFDPAAVEGAEVVGTLTGTFDAEPTAWRIYEFTTPDGSDLSLATWGPSGAGVDLVVFAFPENGSTETALLLSASLPALPSACPCTLEGEDVFAAILPYGEAAGGMALQGAYFSGFDEGQGPAGRVTWVFDSFDARGAGSYAATGTVEARLVGFQDLMMGLGEGAGTDLSLKFRIDRILEDPFR